MVINVTHSLVFGEQFGDDIHIRYASPNATVFVNEESGYIHAYDYDAMMHVPVEIYDVATDPVILELGATEYEQEMQRRVDIHRNGDKRQGLIGR